MRPSHGQHVITVVMLRYDASNQRDSHRAEGAAAS
jgi:hypothetical protein